MANINSLVLTGQLEQATCFRSRSRGIVCNESYFGHDRMMVMIVTSIVTIMTLVRWLNFGLLNQRSDYRQVIWAAINISEASTIHRLINHKPAMAISAMTISGPADSTFSFPPISPVPDLDCRQNDRAFPSGFSKWRMHIGHRHFFLGTVGRDSIATPGHV
jgi:hypothetical protein